MHSSCLLAIKLHLKDNVYYSNNILVKGLLLDIVDQELALEQLKNVLNDSDTNFTLHSNGGLMERLSNNLSFELLQVYLNQLQN